MTFGMITFAVRDGNVKTIHAITYFFLVLQAVAHVDFYYYFFLLILFYFVLFFAVRRGL